jgi:hypothetical protein
MRSMKIYRALAMLAAAAVLVLAANKSAVAQAPSLPVGPQYDTTHVYVAPEDFDRFVDSLIATFGGTKSQPAVISITPTPSETKWQAVFTPVGTFSVFGFKTPIPYPFGSERTGYLVSDFDAAIDSAKANHADIVVAPFEDPPKRSRKPGLYFTGSCRCLCQRLYRLCKRQGGCRRPKRAWPGNRQAERRVSPYRDRFAFRKSRRTG